MPEEFSTRDIFEQVDARLTNLEQDLRGFRSEVHSEFLGLRSEIRSESTSIRTELRSEFTNIRSEVATQGRWLVGMILASWLTLMASIWLKQ